MLTSAGVDADAGAPPAAALPGQPGAPRPVRAADRLGRCRHGAARLRRRAAGQRDAADPGAQRALSAGRRRGRRGAALHRAAPASAASARPSSAGSAGSASAASWSSWSRRWPKASSAAFLDLGETSRIARRHPLHRHARQRHPAAARAAARAGRRGRAPAQPAAARRRRPPRGGRLRHPAAARRHAAAGAAGLHALPLAVRRAVRHRPLQRRQLGGLPGPVRRRHASPARACSTCGRCTRCCPAACPKARC